MHQALANQKLFGLAILPRKPSSSTSVVQMLLPLLSSVPQPQMKRLSERL